MFLGVPVWQVCGHRTGSREVLTSQRDVGYALQGAPYLKGKVGYRKDCTGESSPILCLVSLVELRIKGED